MEQPDCVIRTLQEYRQWFTSAPEQEIREHISTVLAAIDIEEECLCQAADEQR